MVFQIITQDKRILTVHTEVGDGFTKVVVDDSEQEHEVDDEPSDALDE